MPFLGQQNILSSCSTQLQGSSLTSDNSEVMYLCQSDYCGKDFSMGSWLVKKGAEDQGNTGQFQWWYLKPK